MRITIKPFELRGFNLSPDIYHVYLRVYALNYFVRQSDGVIVQPGGPAESPFYEEWACTRNNGSLLLPIALESTIDALSPAHPESIRYYAGFFDPGGNMLCAFWPRPIFALDTDPNPTTWAHVVAYNSPGVEFDWTTTHAEHYSKEEFDKLLQNPPQSFGGITVLPPLYFDGTTLWIPRASTTQDGYLAAEDFIAFSVGAGMGVISFNTRQGVIVLLSQDVLDALTYAPVNRAGDTLTGPLILAGHPSTGSPFEAATRGYVDSVVGGTPGDVTPPAITNVHTSTPGTTSVTIMWDTTGEASDSQVEYGNPGGASGSYPNSTSITNPSPGVTSHSVPLSTLTPGATYHYRVKSRDFATTPNVGMSADNTFTTAASGGDTTPPVITLAGTPVTAITSSGATINWTTSENADSEVRYSTDTSYGTATVPPVTNTPVSTAGVTTHAVSLTSLAAGQLYHYQVKGKDAAGNAATPVTGTFTTAATAFDPTALPNLVEWHEADSITTLSDGDGVALWPDDGPNGFDLTQTTPGNQPTFHTNQVNGLPAVQCFSDGSTIFRLFKMNFTGDRGQPNTFYAVIRIDSANAGHLQDHLTFLDKATPNRNLIALADSTKYQMFAGNLLNSATAQTRDTFIILEVIFDSGVGGTGSLMTINGGVVISGDVGPQPFGDGLLGSGESGTAVFTGAIAAYGFFDDRKDDTTRGQIRAYLGTKYNITTT